tara:strand:- start:2531 stop:3490 length:960 start_codon:yes stop_codon:yes gene_type:complete
MSLTNFDIFNKWTQLTATEVVDQQTSLWNGATRNALTLVSAADNAGDYAEKSSYALMAGLYGNRDPSSVAALASTPLATLKEAAVKVGMGSLPMEYTGSAFDWTKRDPQEAGIAFGEQVGAAKFQYMLNSALAAIVGAITNVGATAVFDGTAATANLGALNSGARKFGDRATSLVTWIMHSKSLHDIYGDSLTNTGRLFEFETIQVVQDGFGRMLIMTDSPALFFDNVGTDNYYQVGLTAGGVMMEDNGDSRVYTETKTEFDNAKQLMKEEASFNLGLKGYTWNTAVVQPDDAALALGTNWTQSATSFKDTAGVITQTL